MILIALGSNLTHPVYGAPRDICEAAIASLARHDIITTQKSSWFSTQPVPISDQPWFVNGVIAVRTPHDSELILRILHRVEDDFGRVRQAMNEARILDLDLLAFHDTVRDQSPILPHPRLHERGFVLYPLAEIAPDWHHPVTGQSVAAMIALLPVEQQMKRL